MYSSAADDVASPDLIGANFVKQYYTVLNSSPDGLLRFYKEDSLFSRGDVDDEFSKPVQGIEAIRSAISSFNLQGCVTVVKHVDSQRSLNGSVLILITGEFTVNVMRKFSHVIYLAPQESGGYYVFNDIFRYTDTDTKDIKSEVEESSVSDDIENATISQTSSSQEDSAVAEELPQSESIPEAEAIIPSQVPFTSSEEIEVSSVSKQAELIDEAISQNTPPVNVEPAPKVVTKMTWADIAAQNSSLSTEDSQSIMANSFSNFPHARNPSMSKTHAEKDNYSQSVNTGRNNSPSKQNKFQKNQSSSPDSPIYELVISNPINDLVNNDYNALFANKLPQGFTIKSVKVLRKNVYVVFGSSQALQWVLNNKPWVLNGIELSIKATNSNKPLEPQKRGVGRSSTGAA